MKKKFNFEFDDVSHKNEISFEYDGDESLKVEIVDGQPFIYVNKSASAFLARFFAKLALGEYQNGFHIHFKEDFEDEPNQDVLAVLVDNEDSNKTT